ncbi:hypothetical protein [Rhodomicrobium sp.]|uniref:hypothetical protein n=1 Tax=Rhodomicrobium sp. TaxID=2720632 RepID=UPI0039E68A48
MTVAAIINERLFRIKAKLNAELHELRKCEVALSGLGRKIITGPALGKIPCSFSDLFVKIHDAYPYGEQRTD